VVNQKPKVALSFYLDGVQIIEKNSEFGTGQVAAAFEPVTTPDDDDIPF
jgi:hypothetical protein